MKNIKYTPRIGTALIYLALFGVAILLFLGRKGTFYKIQILLNTIPDFYQHVSNFSISYLLFSGIGYVWLLLGVNFKFIVGLGTAILLSNFVYESWIAVLNTPDIVDAFYGFAGTILSFIFLWLTKKYGLKINTVPDR